MFVGDFVDVVDLCVCVGELVVLMEVMNCLMNVIIVLFE